MHLTQIKILNNQISLDYYDTIIHEQSSVMCASINFWGKKATNTKLVTHQLKIHTLINCNILLERGRHVIRVTETPFQHKNCYDVEEELLLFYNNSVGCK